jgi:hypothetical protein
VVRIAGRCAAEAGEVPRALQPRASAQFAGGSDAIGVRGVAQRKSEYIAGARTPESLDRASGVRETRVNRGRKDLHCPKPLTSPVTENGSGPSCNLSYPYVNESWGQVIPSRRSRTGGIYHIRRLFAINLRVDEPRTFGSPLKRRERLVSRKGGRGLSGPVG